MTSPRTNTMSTRSLSKIVAGTIAAFTIATAVLAWLGLDIVQSVVEAAPQVGLASEPSVGVLSSAQDAIGELRLALDDLAVVTDQVGASSGDLVTVLEGVSTLTTEDVPETLRAIEDGLPALVQTASLIDDTMRTLSVFGVQYDPAVPFDESLTAIQASLDGLPEEIAAQGEVIEETIPGVADSAERIGTLGERIRSIDADLAAAEQALGGYDTALTGLGTFAESADGIAATLPLARAAVIVLTLAGLGLAIGSWHLADRIAFRQATVVVDPPVM